MNDTNGLQHITTDNKRLIAPWQITLAAIGACLSLILMSVEAKAGGDRAEPSDAAMIAKELALTKEQAEDVDRVLTEVAVRRSQVKESSGELTREQLRIELKEITEYADDQLRTILSDDQFAKYVALRSEIRREALRQRVRDTRVRIY